MAKRNKDEKFAMSQKQTSSMINQKREQMLSLLKKTEIEFPVGLIVDMSGTCGRDIVISMKTLYGMDYEDAATSIDELITSYAKEGQFPTLLWVVPWERAQSLLQLIDTTATEMLKKAKSSMLSGDWLIVGIGRDGYTFQVFAELSPDCI